MEMLDGVTLMEVDETGDRRWVLEGSSAKQSEGVKIRFFDVIVTLFRKDGSVVIHGIRQSRILERVPSSFPRASSRPKD